jgi:hypothetical protein
MIQINAEVAELGILDFFETFSASIMSTMYSKVISLLDKNLVSKPLTWPLTSVLMGTKVFPRKSAKISKIRTKIKTKYEI